MLSEQLVIPIRILAQPKNVVKITMDFFENGRMVALSHLEVIVRGGYAHRNLWTKLEAEDWFHSPPPPNFMG